MTRSKNRKAKLTKPAKTPSVKTLSPKEQKTRWYIQPNFYVPMVFSIVALLFGSFFVIPKVSFSISAPYDVTRPLTVDFIVTNEDPYPLRYVTVGIALCEIDGIPKLVGDCKQLGATELVVTSRGGHTLLNDENLSLSPADIFPNDIKGVTGADIGVVITFQPWFIPIKRMRTYRAIAQMGLNGVVQWRAEPLN